MWLYKSFKPTIYIYICQLVNQKNPSNIIQHHLTLDLPSILPVKPTRWTPILGWSTGVHCEACRGNGYQLAEAVVPLRHIDALLQGHGDCVAQWMMELVRVSPK